MNKQAKALAAAVAAFLASLGAVYFGQAEAMSLQDAVGPLGVAFAAWLGTYIAPKNKA